MPLAETVIAQWGLFGVVVVVLATVAVYLEKKRRALESELTTTRAELTSSEKTHAAKMQTMQTAHGAELERQRRDFELRAEAQRQAHQAERAELMSKLDAEHRERLSDQKAATQALLSFADRMHGAIAQLRELADRIAQLPR